MKEFFKLEAEEVYELFRHIAIVSGTLKRLHRIKRNGNEYELVDEEFNGLCCSSNSMIETKSSDSSDNKVILPDGVYTFKRKIQRLNVIAKGIMCVSNGKGNIKKW